MPTSKICPVCEQSFVPRYSAKKFCSRECFRNQAKQFTCEHCGCQYRMLNSQNKGTKYCSKTCKDAARSNVTLTCQHCDKEYESIRWRAPKSKYCSMECLHTSNIKPPNHICQFCNKEYHRKPHLKESSKYCSVKCRGKAQRSKISRRCRLCNCEFRVTLRNTVFCSWQCYSNWKEKHGTTFINCECCSKRFRIRLSTVNSRRFCSRKCFHLFMGPTSIELAAQEALKELKIEFISEYKIGRYAVDCFLPHLKIALEIDGDHWHSLPGVSKRDARKDKFLNSKGLTVVRISETEITEAQSVPELISNKIK